MKTSRRSFVSKTLTATAALGTGFFPKAQNFVPLPSLIGRKVLFTYGGWEGHEPIKYREYLAPWMKEEGAEVLTFDNLDPYTDEELMNRIDLVVQIFTMSTITQEQEKGLLAAIKNGVGMAGWHGGMGDAFRQNTEYQYMVGGQWVAHPGGVIPYRVNVPDTGDAITDGLNNFDITSEQYYMHVDPNVKVLATTRFYGEHDPWIEGCTMPVAWKKSYGKGRIFYTSLGHNLQHVLDAPEGMTIIKRGIRWASASRYEPMETWVRPKY